MLKLLENKKLIAAFLIVFGFILLGERLWFYKKVRQKLIKPYVEGSFSKIEPNRSLIIKDLPAFQLDGELSEWKGVPFALHLSATENQNIQVMLAKTPQGLALGFQFSGSAEGLARTFSDEDKLFFHLRLKFLDLLLPPLGVGNQHGYLLLKEGQSEDPFTCEIDPKSQAHGYCGDDGQDWYQTQMAYRRELKKLFERQWIISLKEAQEIRATESWKQLNQMRNPSEKSSDVAATEVIKLLNPANQPALQVREYLPRSFEVLISWNALPPADQLKLENLSLTLSLEKSQAPSSKVAESSSAASENEVRRFLTFDFETPKEFTLTPCHYSLEAEDPYNNKIPAYFFPAETSELQSTWSFVNLVRGYLDSFEGLSPILQKNDYWVQKLGDQEWVCGPKLSYQKNDVTTRYACSANAPLQQGEKICPPDIDQRFLVKKLLNGLIRIQNGPWLTTASRFGSGQCGSCPYLGIESYVIDAQQKLKLVFEYSHVVNTVDADIKVSEEGEKITILEGEDLEDNKGQQWNAKTYCWKDAQAVYQLCEDKKTIQTPETKNVDWENKL